ncbi:MAG: GNAT family N-acetyltransferase [Rhizonema sp. PD37]|nr:GNAT family N-acetyltransferase [Rhizonema sp. PD37]
MKRSIIIEKLTTKVVTIRAYVPNDLENTVPLWYRTWHQTFPNLQHPQPYHTWKARFHNDLARRGEVWLAELENQIVGLVLVIQETQELNQLFVDHVYQNRGIGSDLLNKAKEICPQRLTLQTLQQNTKACKFYEKHGFKASKLATNEINGQPNIEYYWVPSLSSLNSTKSVNL